MIVFLLHLLPGLNPAKLQWLWVFVVVTGALLVYGVPHLICPWRSRYCMRGSTTPGLVYTATGMRQSR